MLPATKGKVHFFEIHLDLATLLIDDPVEVNFSYHSGLKVCDVVCAQKPRALIDVCLFEERSPSRADTISVYLAWIQYSIRTEPYCK